MSNHEEENLDVIAGLSAQRDDNLYAGAPAGKVANGAKTGTSKSSRNGKPTGGSHNLLLTIVLLALVGCCGWLGLQTFQLQEQLANAKEQITLARKHLDILGAKLSETGDTFSETENSYDKQFKFWESEIRKLWAVSNERNKKAIAANTSSLKKLGNEVKQALSKSEASQKEAKTISGNYNRLRGDLTSENTAIKASLEDQSEQLMLLRGELELIQKRFGNVPNNLSERVQNNEDAVQAIDAARRQLISSVTQLQSQLNELQRSIDGGTALP